MRKNPLLPILLPGLAQVRANDDLLLYWRFDSPYRYGFAEPDSSGHSHDGLLVWARTRGGGGGEYVPEAGKDGNYTITIGEQTTSLQITERPGDIRKVSLR